MKITYRSIQPEDYDQVRALLIENGWAARVTDAEQFRAIVERADRAVVALNDERVVGFARALSDGVSNAYISMVAVAADVRRQGVGRRLVEHLMKGDTGDITWVLRAGRDSRGFWERLGFSASQIAMERVRRS